MLAASRAASLSGVSADTNSTSVRGSSTSRSCRFPASKTSATISRSSWLSAWLLATRSRSSSSVMTVRLALGLPPTMVTTRLVDFDSSHTSGRARMAIRSRIGAAASATRSCRCSAIRLGASSPRISVT